MGDYILKTNDDGSLALVHHGIKGQKWGERNYQYEDGSLTPAGKERYYKGYTSSATKTAMRNYKKFGGGFKKGVEKSAEYDKKIAEYEGKQSFGKKLLKDGVFGSTAHTYNMSRAAGESRGKAFARSVFDVNVNSMLSTAAGIGATAAGYALASKYIKNPVGLGLAAAGAGLAGYTISRGVNKALNPKEMSIQQKILRNKQMRS